MVGPFLVFGLRFRTAVVTGRRSPIGVYATAAAIFGLPLPMIVRSCLLLIVVAAACGVVARTLERSARTRFLETHAMAELAQQDALTGVKNRRVFDEHLEESWQRAIDEERGARDPADRRRSLQGLQRPLRSPGRRPRAAPRRARCCRCSSRARRLLARYGGEEFAVLLYDVDAVAAEKLAAQMRKAVGAMGLEHRDSRLGQIVTISIGVAIVEPSLERRARGALQLADEALYQAKTRGRNRVEVLDPARAQGARDRRVREGHGHAPLARRRADPSRRSVRYARVAAHRGSSLAWVGTETEWRAEARRTHAQPSLAICRRIFPGGLAAPRRAQEANCVGNLGDSTSAVTSPSPGVVA